MGGSREKGPGIWDQGFGIRDLEVGWAVFALGGEMTDGIGFRIVGRGYAEGVGYRVVCPDPESLVPGP